MEEKTKLEFSGTLPPDSRPDYQLAKRARHATELAMIMGAASSLGFPEYSYSTYTPPEPTAQEKAICEAASQERIRKAEEKRKRRAERWKQAQKK